MVRLLFGGLDEAQKFELWHSSDETGTGEQAEEQYFFTVDFKQIPKHLICYEVKHIKWIKNS